MIKYPAVFWHLKVEPCHSYFHIPSVCLFVADKLNPSQLDSVFLYSSLTSFRLCDQVRTKNNIDCKICLNRRGKKTTPLQWNYGSAKTNGTEISSVMWWNSLLWQLLKAREGKFIDRIKSTDKILWIISLFMFWVQITLEVDFAFCFFSVEIRTGVDVLNSKNHTESVRNPFTGVVQW